MKKHLFIFFAFLPLLSHGQIILDNMKKNNTEDNSSISNLLKITQYQASILGAATACQANKDDMAIFYNDFYSKINILKINNEEKEKIEKTFKSNFLYKRDSFNKKECPQFQPEFNKIIELIKQKNQQ